MTKNDDELIRTAETLMEIYGGEDKVLTRPNEQGKCAAVFSGPVQVDAAARVDAALEGRGRRRSFRA